jgi:hypothetical protein
MILRATHRTVLHKVFKHSATSEYYPVAFNPSRVTSETVSEEFPAGALYTKVSESGVSRWEGVYLAPNGTICLLRAPCIKIDDSDELDEHE